MTFLDDGIGITVMIWMIPRQGRLEQQYIETPVSAAAHAYKVLAHARRW